MDGVCNVRVVCRYRPHNKIEDTQGGQQVCSFPSKDSVKQNGRPYQFDRVFDPSTSQHLLYKEAAQPIVSDVLKGRNGTMFAYGQTSSGKTHTMEGVLDDDDLRGVIPRIVDDIFTYIQQMDPSSAEEDNKVDNFMIKVSYFEIYMERIHDLLDVTKKNLSIHEDEKKSPYVKDLTEIFVSEPQEVYELIAKGKSNRRVAATNMNLHSSRSHSILQITVKQSLEGEKKTLQGKLYLVDLAGSEKVGKTGAAGLTLEEAKNINKSLSALGNVISALTESTKRGHVPYRDSKLTRILQESLGGNAKTTMVICCSPSSFNDLETKSTLDFGKRAKAIKNRVVINEELTAEEWKKRYQKEHEKNDKLNRVLTALETEVRRWRAGEKVGASEQVGLASKRAVTGTRQGQSTGGNIAAAVATAAAAGVPMPSVGDAGILAEARQAFEEERKKLFADLDEKDGEINSLGQEVERLKVANVDLQELVEMTSSEAAAHLKKLTGMQEECDQNAEQVKEVYKALEDMALNYDTKNQELDEQREEFEKLKEVSETVQNDLQVTRVELKSLQEQILSRHGDLENVLNHWYNSLVGLGSELQCDMDSCMRPNAATLEESIASLRLLDTNLHSSLKALTRRSDSLSATLHSTENELSSRLEDISNLKLRVSQYEADSCSYESNLTELQQSNQSLQAALDSLSQEMTALTAAANAQAAQRGSGSKDTSQRKADTENQIQSLQNQHAQKIAVLRSDVEKKQAELKASETAARHQELETKHLQAEMLELRQIQRANMEKIAELTMEKEAKERAVQETQALRSAVAKESQRLAEIKRAFLQTVRRRGAESDPSSSAMTAPVPGGDHSGNSSSQKAAFLQNNLDQLTTVHKQLLQSHKELQREFSKLDARVKAKVDRISLLETAITNIKKNYQEKRKQLTEELDQIKKSYEAKMKRGGVHRSTIVKAIKPGHQPASSKGAGRTSASVQASSQTPLRHSNTAVATAYASESVAISPGRSSSSSSSSGSSRVLKQHEQSGRTQKAAEDITTHPDMLSSPVSHAFSSSFSGGAAPHLTLQPSSAPSSSSPSLIGSDTSTRETAAVSSSPSDYANGSAVGHRQDPIGQVEQAAVTAAPLQKQQQRQHRSGRHHRSQRSGLGTEQSGLEEQGRKLGSHSSGGGVSSDNAAFAAGSSTARATSKSTGSHQSANRTSSGSHSGRRKEHHTGANSSTQHSVSVQMAGGQEHVSRFAGSNRGDGDDDAVVVVDAATHSLAGDRV